MYHLGSHLQHMQLQQLHASCIEAHCLALCSMQHLHACACRSPYACLTLLDALAARIAYAPRLFFENGFWYLIRPWHVVVALHVAQLERP